MRIAIALVLVAFFFSAMPAGFAQSRRVPPGTSTVKPNRRAADPAPTPTPPAAADDAIDSGDVVEVDTKLVSIPVRVLDRKNRFIAGLTKEDFKVFDEEVEQEIAYFTNETQPFTVALVLDMSYSTVFKIGEIQAAAIAFIDQLRPEDKVMVISFDQDVHMLSEATNDRASIYRAIRSTRIATGTSLYEAVDMTINERLRRLQGRKAMVLFTDGVDTTSRRSHDLENLRDAMELDALIYPIRYDTFADVQAIKNKAIVLDPRPTSNPTGLPFPLPGQVPTIATPSDKGTTAAEYARAEEYLDKLALRTSGRVYLASNPGSLNSAFAKIAAELREFYSIGYYPAVEGLPGKTRRIKVRTTQPDMVVRARDSYVVPRKRTLRSY